MNLAGSYFLHLHWSVAITLVTQCSLDLNCTSHQFKHVRGSRCSFLLCWKKSHWICRISKISSKKGKIPEQTLSRRQFDDSADIVWLFLEKCKPGRCFDLIPEVCLYECVRSPSLKAVITVTTGGAVYFFRGHTSTHTHMHNLINTNHSGEVSEHEAVNDRLLYITQTQTHTHSHFLCNWSVYPSSTISWL